MSEPSAFGSEDRRGAIRYWQAITAHKILLISIVLLTTAVSAVFAFMAPKRYEATADIIVAPLAQGDDVFQGFSLLRASSDGSPLVTAARVFGSQQVRGPASAAMARAGVSDVTIDITPVSQADIVSITATAETATAAAKAANVFALSVVNTRTGIFQRELADRIKRLSARVAAVPEAQRPTNFEYAALAGRLAELRGYVGTSDPTLSIVSKASVPTAPSWPRPKLTIAAAMLASLLLGIGLAVLLEFANPRVSREDQLQFDQRLPILARIPKLSARTAHAYLIGKSRLPSTAWKGYRALRASLATAGSDGKFPRSILVTSASPGDGKTMTAVNLAITLAASDMRVALVDADVHRPMVSSIFQLPARAGGFTGVLADPATLDSILVPAPAHPRLMLLLSRREQLAQLRLFDGPRIKRTLDALKREVDIVVIDAPPLPEVAEALEIAAQVDAVLVAVRIGHTRRDKLDELREMLSRRGTEPIGLVVTTRSGADLDNEYDYDAEVPAMPSRSAQRGRQPVAGVRD